MGPLCLGFHITGYTSPVVPFALFAMRKSPCDVVQCAIGTDGIAIPVKVRGVVGEGRHFSGACSLLVSMLVLTDDE